MDLIAARSFMTTHARVLDRRRFDADDPQATLAAVDGYRNADSGYGWGLEPDLRSPESQPGGALHALEAFADAAPLGTPHAAELCDWLDSVTLPDGGLPFALPVGDPAGVAPFWATADPHASSLQITALVAATAHRVAAHDSTVAAHPWLARATDYCRDAIGGLDEQPFALALWGSLSLVDAIGDEGLAERLPPLLPPPGVPRGARGAPGAAERPPDLGPPPGGPG